ncbi:secondary thiamine-phosphate synthase enzyme YjbQ [Rubellicoccus peritrichatus]|uniref:Secondary thiamine-phosphate synthase enzyme YjbQ n=1 Tax=Rubellicoccus peritrichatus TaxID=3080537 RepID=A0AAQ3QR21_9BACT|nr:secondary thiamine-phosphate synthase enzyme YjbQ [Puniceicoccus sp. CR14]WOO40868.1 secondary thiamine-phosphate synthase enzyme YjbQ [Puniceicoccus sp. CR14]
MPIYTKTVTVRTSGQGTYEITNEISSALRSTGLNAGAVTVFCQHTSCSLVIMENADPSARHDLHYFMDKLVPDDDPNYTHTMEGPDDMTSHIKMALTRTAEVIPFDHSRLCLGTWQGVFLWEHRDAPHGRRIVLSFNGE